MMQGLHRLLSQAYVLLRSFRAKKVSSGNIIKKRLAALETHPNEYLRKKYENLSSMSREELLNETFKLEGRNFQLKNLLAKSNQIGDDSALSSRFKVDLSLKYSKHQKRHILLKFAYLGWERQGFNAQEDTPNTVEAALFEALVKTNLVESRQTCNYHRCGRTDKGVSAFSQVISITVRSRLERPLNQEVSQNVNSEFNATKVSTQDEAEENEEDLENELNYPKILNRALPADIMALSWSPIQQDFSARFNCLTRTYKYFFPLANLNLESMQTAAQFLIGEHDFRNFCKMDVGNGVVKFIRKIYSISISEVDSENFMLSDDIESCALHKKSFEGDNSVLSRKGGYKMCVATVEGKAFLWHQIRAIMAILILVGEGKENPEITKKLLDVDVITRKPQYGLAREDGLILYDTIYEGINWKYDWKNISLVLYQLKDKWTEHSIKSSMLQSMISDLSDSLSEIRNLKSHNLPWTLENVHVKKNRRSKTKIYKPILSRKTCKNLEECVQTHVRRGRLDPILLTIKRNENISS